MWYTRSVFLLELLTLRLGLASAVNAISAKNHTCPIQEGACQQAVRPWEA
jgi:hypothetical protein